MKQFKKILSVLLSVLMVLSVFSATTSTVLASDIRKGVADIYKGYELPAPSRAARANLDFVPSAYSGAIAEISRGFNNFSTEINLANYNLSPAALEAIYNYLIFYKQYYYLEGYYHYSVNPENGLILSLLPDYTMSRSTVIAGNQLIKEKIDALVASASKLSTDIEKIIYAHDYVVGNIDYDTSYNQAHNNIYYAVKNGSTMCVGYAELFNLALTRLGIKSYIVTSDQIAHAWNLVYLDGNYYHVDCTFDDPYYENPNLVTHPISGNFSYENLMCSFSYAVRTGHESNDWMVNGYNVYSYADSNTYDNFFWRGLEDRMVYGDKYWCFAYSNDSVSAADAGFKLNEVEFYSNTRYNIKEVRNIKSCYTLSNGQKYTQYYTNLQPCGSEIYYKTDNGIYVYNRDSSTDTCVFKPERTDNIYDFVINEDDNTFSIMYGNSFTDRGVLLTYDIDEYFCSVTGHSYVWKTINSYQVNCCSKCGAENYRLQFIDLVGYEIYDDYVAYTSMYNNFIAGTNPPKYTEFSPRTAITRAMFVAILYRMAGNPYENGNNPHSSNPFTDIQSGAYYYNAACWALDENITNQLTFKPNDNVTREQTARFLFAYAEANHMLGNAAYKNVNLNDYPDYDSVHSWAVEPLQWANYNDMMTGTSQGYINPQGATQRIHATRVLCGFGKACNIGNFG